MKTFWLLASTASVILALLAAYGGDDYARATWHLVWAHMLACWGSLYDDSGDDA